MTAPTPPTPPFRDPDLPFAERIDDLLSRLTLDERIGFLHQFGPAVERLGVAAFRTGQEALHGVAWMGPATVFPQAVGLGATWNEDLVRRVGEAVSREARAMRARDERVGLNVWVAHRQPAAPPRCGAATRRATPRIPRLTSAIATAYTRGLRGDHPVYWRTAPVLKHWLAHNNETRRDTTSSSVRPARAARVRPAGLPRHRGGGRGGRGDAGVQPGQRPPQPCVARTCASSCAPGPGRSCWSAPTRAPRPTWSTPSTTSPPTRRPRRRRCARASTASPTTAPTARSSSPGSRGRWNKGLLTEEDVDTAVRRQLSVRFRLGEFDPGRDPYAG
ncbi:glycoside hydrolase family 3 N-terminal domain-containing protein [Streptomyces prasinosporus]|uniref:glycoside hydrolase family 3 N-terminal domain-containing protein n=1 Tax=Streptomyces prasinosporus TaxID=68256 RepID=UPI0031F0A6F9